MSTEVDLPISGLVYMQAGQVFRIEVRNDTDISVQALVGVLHLAEHVPSLDMGQSPLFMMPWEFPDTPQQHAENWREMQRWAEPQERVMGGASAVGNAVGNILLPTEVESFTGFWGKTGIGWYTPVQETNGMVVVANGIQVPRQSTYIFSGIIQLLYDFSDTGLSPIGVIAVHPFLNSPAQAVANTWHDFSLGDSGTAAGLAAHIANTTDAHDASAISVLDTANDFTATDVEGALAELQSDHETDAQNLADHLADTSDAHDASAISVLDTAGDFDATDVESALAELQSEHDADVVTLAQAIADHLTDTADAHDASAISILDTADDFDATNVEAALAELQTDHEADALALANHLADTDDAHDASAISVLDTEGHFLSDDVEAALAELSEEIDGLIAGGVTSHVISLEVSDPNGSDLATGDGQKYWRVPSTADGMDLIEVGSHLTDESDAGRVRWQVHNVTNAADMLSELAHIKEGDNDSVESDNLFPDGLVLNGTGDSASTPDSPALSVTGDIDIRCAVTPDDWTPTGGDGLIAKWRSSGNQRSYRLILTSGGNLQLIHSADGAASIAMTSTVATGTSDGTSLLTRATLDVDDGAGNRVATFYTKALVVGNVLAQLKDSMGWTQLGATVTTAGTTSIFDGTSPCVLGQNGDNGGYVAGTFLAAVIYDGIDGTLVASPDFSSTGVPTATPGASTYTDAQSNVWTLAGNAFIDDVDQTPIIDLAEATVATGDELRIDVDEAGTTAKGLLIDLTFGESAGVTARFTGILDIDDGTEVTLSLSDIGKIILIEGGDSVASGLVLPLDATAAIPIGHAWWVSTTFIDFSPYFAVENGVTLNVWLKSFGAGPVVHTFGDNPFLLATTPNSSSNSNSNGWLFKSAANTFTYVPV